MLPGDHVLAVDDELCMEESHYSVVERIRRGDGKGKKILVIDVVTESEMKAKVGERLKVYCFVNI